MEIIIHLAALVLVTLATINVVFLDNTSTAAYLMASATFIYVAWGQR